jgi:uncharacterized membrane protein YphA (DoxX/SURF4 family)
VKNTDNNLYDDGRRTARVVFEPLARFSSTFVVGSLLGRPMGLRVYGAGAVALGVVGLVWGDFALVWQPVPSSVPGRTVLAYLTAAALLLAGTALQWRRTQRAGIIALSILCGMCVLLLHVPRVIAHPAQLSTWAGVAEQLALVAAGLVAHTAVSPTDERVPKRVAQIGRSLFALCLFSFGLVHFVYASATASFVPNWLPPGQMFWAYTTGVAHWAAGLAILSGILASAAARLLTVMFIVFSILVHAPALLVDSSHFSWAANAMNLALIGGAWVIADSVAVRKAS